MIIFKNLIEEKVEAIKANPFFADKKITVSYPYVKKPTFLENPVIAVGLFDMNLYAEHLGEDAPAGTVKVFCDCFFPYEFNASSRQEVLSEVCKSVIQAGALAVYADEPASSKATACIIRRLIFTFKDETDFN